MSERGGTLVGRARELDAVDQLLERTLAGDGGVALVAGEPGIGKTRLLEEVAARAASRGFAVAWGRAWELGSAPTYWPWIEALRSLLGRSPDRDAAAAVLLPLLPELGPRGAGGREQQPTEHADVFALCDAVSAYLRELAAREPLLVVLDDLHAADPSSLQLTEFVARSLRGVRLCLLGSHRDVEARLSVDIEQSLARLARAGELLLPQRLSATEVEQLVRDQIGQDGAEAARMIHEVTEGNPLFVRELLRLLRARGAGRHDGVPAGVRAVIRERLALLSPASVALLQAAAVVGREFSVWLAAEVAGVTASALEDAAAEARGADVLADAGPGRLRFSHALVAETLAAELQPKIRARLHQRAAEALERRRAADPGVPLDEIAHHFLQAGAEAAPRAVLAAERAAAAAAARLAFADAATSYERALSALELCQPDDPLRRAELLIACGEAHVRAGDRARAEPVCLRAVELARALHDGALLSRAALALGAEVSPGARDPLLIRLLQEALVLLPPGDGPWRAQAAARLASARQPEDDPALPMAIAREAIAMARRIGDAALLLRVLHSAIGALVDFAPAQERAQLNAETARLAEAAGDRPRCLRAKLRLAFDCIELADLAGFERAMAEHEAIARETAQPRYLWVSPMLAAMRADLEGRFADADRLEAQARAIYERVRGDGPEITPLRTLSKGILREDAELIERGWLIQAARSPDAWAPNQLSYACVLAHKGCLTEAAAVMSVLQAQFPNPPEHIHLLDTLSDVVWLLRDQSIAQRLYPVLLVYAGRPFMVTGIGFSVYGLVDHALMRLSALCGRWQDVDRHAEAALALCTQLGARPIAAKVWRDWALAQSMRGNAESSARALPLLRRAAEAFDQIGSSDKARACRELAAAFGGEAQPVAPAPDAREPIFGVQIEREGEYWTLRGLGELCRIRDSRGLQMLAQLLERAGQELHVLDLSGALEAVDGGDAGELTDREALAAYEQRLRELQQEIEEAAGWNDSGRRERLEREAEQLRDELTRARGLGGRERRAASAIERARVNVRRRLSLALRKIEQVSPRLGAHLSASVRTGFYCAYEPRVELPERSRRPQ